MLRVPLALLAAGALALAALAAPAAASKKPTSAQARAITRAVENTSLGGAKNVPKRWYRVSGIRISSASDYWAFATQTPTRAGRGKFQPAFFLLANPQGSKRWVVMSMGTAEVGCGIAPAVVLKDLFNAECPPGEGIKGDG